MIGVGLFLIATLWFELQPNSLIHLGMAVVSASLGFVGIMMLLAVLGKTERAAGGIGWAILLMMSMIGGGMIPLFIMPGWMRSVSHISPVKWAMLAMEGAIWRQYTFMEMPVPCGILLAVGLGCFVIGVTAFQWIQES
ncbi:ABC transporter permease [bacterium]|nr:ABC transporter permease [candidate division CSSED10-310 bacterium]